MGETLVTRLLRIKHHKCKTFTHRRESRRPLREFLVFKQSREIGKSPLTVGFIMCVPDAHSRIWMSFGDGKKEAPNVKGHIRIFNHTYNGNKEFKGCVTVLDSEKDWKVHTFSVTPDKDYSERGGLITKFYQTKGAGTAARGAGTDVAFMISTGRTLKKTIWNFDVKKPPHKQPRLELSTHHVYKRAGKYSGNITVEDHEGNKKTHDFDVVVSRNQNNPCCDEFVITKV